MIKIDDQVLEMVSGGTKNIRILNPIEVKQLKGILGGDYVVACLKKEDVNTGSGEIDDDSINILRRWSIGNRKIYEINGIPCVDFKHTELLRSSTIDGSFGNIGDFRIGEITSLN